MGGSERRRVLGGLALATVVPLVVVPLLAGSGRAQELVLGALVVVVYTGHVAATAWMGTHREVRALVRDRPLGLLVLPVLALAGGSAVSLAVPPGRLSWVLAGFFVWQFTHFQRQNLGLVSLVASGEAVPGLHRAERRALLAPLGVALVAFAGHPGLLDLPARGAVAWVFPWARVAMALSVAWGLIVILRRPRSQRPRELLVAFALAAGFFLPVAVFGSPEAAVGSLVVAHGAQYLWLLAGIGGGAKRPTASRASRLLGAAVLADVVVVGGLALAAASDLHRAPGTWPRLGYGLYLGSVCAHFLADRVLWRLRDERTRAFVAGRLPALFPTGAAPLGAL